MKTKGIVLLILSILLITACSTNTDHNTSNNEESFQKILSNEFSESEENNVKDRESSQQIEKQTELINETIQSSETDLTDNSEQPIAQESSIFESEQKEETTLETSTDELVIGNANSIDLSNYDNVEKLTLADEESARFILISSGILKNLTICSIAYDGIDLEVLETFYTCDAFSQNMALDISTYIPPYFSNLMITFESSPGNTVRYFVMSDQRDQLGNVLLMKVPNEL